MVGSRIDYPVTAQWPAKHVTRPGWCVSPCIAMCCNNTVVKCKNRLRFYHEWAKFGLGENGVSQHNKVLLSLALVQQTKHKHGLNLLLSWTITVTLCIGTTGYAVGCKIFFVSRQATTDSVLQSAPREAHCSAANSCHWSSSRLASELEADTPDLYQQTSTGMVYTYIPACYGGWRVS